MAYMNQEKKRKIMDKVKPILKKYGMKGTFSVRNHSTITLTLTEGPIDFIGDLKQERQFGYVTDRLDKDKMRERYELDINPYWFHEHYDGDSYFFLKEIIPAMKSADWFDNSDAQIDYFSTAYYFDVRVGKWNKHYNLTK